MRVHLEWYEKEKAVLVGTLRHRSSFGKHTNHNCPTRETEEESLRIHTGGAAAELAVSKATNRYWHGSVNTFHKGADVGESIQVRWRSREHYDLIIRDDDPDDHYFFLVTGSIEDGFEVSGWIKGSEGKRPEWRRNYGNHRPAFFVPKSALTPLLARRAA